MLQSWFRKQIKAANASAMVGNTPVRMHFLRFWKQIRAKSASAFTEFNPVRMRFSGPGMLRKADQQGKCIRI